MGKAESWARAHKGLVGLLAALAAGLGALLFLLHPKGQQAAQQGISYLQAPFTQQPDAGGTMTTSSSTSTDSATAGFFGLTRDQIPGFPASGQGGTIPLWGDPFNVGAKLLAFLPWDTQVQITGAPVIGRANNGGVTTWYPVQWGGQTGWLSSADFQSFLGTPPPGDVNTDPTSQPTAGPPIDLKRTLSNVPSGSAVMGGVG